MYAQIDISPSLYEAIESALDKSNEIRHRQMEIEKLQLQEKSVWNTYVPKVEGTALYSYFDGRLTMDIPTVTTPSENIQLFEGKTSFDNYGNIFHGSILAKTVIFSGFQIVNGAKAIQRKTEGMQHLLDAGKDVVVREVIHTFDQLTLLDEAEKVINGSEKRLAAEASRVGRAVEQGLAIPYDRDKISLARLELKMRRTELKGKRDVLYQKIHYLTGYSREQAVNVQNKVTPYLITDEKILSIAGKQEIKALESFREAQEYLLKKEKGSYFPTIGAFGGLTYSSLFDGSFTTPTIPLLDRSLNLGLNQATLGPNWLIGLGLRWEIFSGFERHHKISEAKINVRQLQDQIDDTREKLQLLLDNNYANVRVLNEKIEIASQQEKIAQNNVNISVKQYQQGLIGISERLESENDLLKSSMNRVNIIIEQRQATLETLLATGKLMHFISR
nr:TolC family protein [Sinomicrobium weinanense]